MDGDDQAKTDFEQILGNIDRRFEIIDTQWTEQKLFEAKFRTQIPRDNEDFNFLCDEWVELFSQVTDTVWVKKISNTGPKIRFRKQYQCWTHGGKTVQKELLFDARRCKATLDMKVLTDNPLTRRKNKHIRLGLNVVVKINFTHLHPVTTTNPFAFFVHNCEPLPEPPKPVITPNNRLPQLVAEMVQKGLNSTPKAVKNLNTSTALKSANKQQQQLQDALPVLQQQQKINNCLPHQQEKIETTQSTPQTDTILQSPLQYVDDPVQINEIIPIQNIDNIKFQVQPQLAQVVVDVNEPLFMCQPTLMFEPGELIPITTLPPHFVQVHPANGVYSQQSHFL